MSQAALSRPRPAKTERKSVRPVLSVVEDHGPTRSTVSVGLIVIIALAGFIGAPLVLNTVRAELSFSMRDDQVQLDKLTQENEDLLVKVQSVSSPESLRRFADKHQMVPATNPGYITLKSRKIEGGSPAK
ncbi:MAG: hypothetical protein Q4A71_01570 [Actinomycetaceae bacterium]|nr:hypothetical protein [Actinomycetaceae bacterium]